MSRPCPVCGYGAIVRDGRIVWHRGACTPALRSLVREAERWLRMYDGSADESLERAVRRFQEERAR